MAKGSLRKDENGDAIIVITNQACVGRGDLSLAGLARIHDRLREEVAAVGGIITDILVCPHTDTDGCGCRKPQPGLIFEAAEKYEIDLPGTWFVGDAIRDVEAALAAGCRPALVHSGKPIDESPSGNVAIFNDLEDFASALQDNDIA